MIVCVYLYMPLVAKTWEKTLSFNTCMPTSAIWPAVPWTFRSSPEPCWKHGSPPCYVHWSGSLANEGPLTNEGLCYDLQPSSLALKQPPRKDLHRSWTENASRQDPSYPLCGRDIVCTCCRTLVESSNQSPHDISSEQPKVVRWWWVFEKHNQMYDSLSDMVCKVMARSVSNYVSKMNWTKTYWYRQLYGASFGTWPNPKLFGVFQKVPPWINLAKHPDKHVLNLLLFI